MRIARYHVSTLEPGEASDYLAEVAVERSGAQQAVGLYTVRVSSFPRTKKNALALIKAVLDGLTEEDLSLEPDTVSADLARRQHRPLPEIQGGESRLRHNRSSFWSR